MCGICGFTWRDEELVLKMSGEIPHRGPDQDGLWCSAGVSLGHRRLSIIDLSEQARQPMSNEDGSLRMVFNGEIYNFQQLRGQLIAKGHRFISQSDSEVILHAYEEYGCEAVNHLRGMFAFALWDERRQSLWLARDRIGIKPLYYWLDGQKLVFASEIKAILACPQVPRELNHQALYDYLGFEFVPAPETMFRDIRKLPPGHHLLFADGRADLREYWDLSMEPCEKPLRFEEAAERLLALLDEAVASHLVSDVPLGAFLSGGLDSSALVALMRRHVPGRLRTFTIGFPDKTFSELDYAQIVADRFATDHQVLMIDDINAAYLEKSVWQLDEPMTDLSAVPLMLVCAQAKKHVTVCMSGEGGDESFAGYDRFKASRINRFYSGLLPAFFRRGVIGKALAMLPDRPQKKGAINMLKRFSEGANLPGEGGHLRWQYFGSAQQDRLLFQQRFLSRISADPFRQVRQYAAKCSVTDRVNREIYLDTRFMMPNGVLMKVDKMSMASSLEVRVPFLDHVFVEYMASLPGDWKLKGLTTKHIFRAALKGVLPDEIIFRGKQGYSLPVKHLLRNQLRDYMIGLLNESPLLRDNLNGDHVRRLMREHLASTHNHNHVLWALMNAAIWQNRFQVNC